MKSANSIDPTAVVVRALATELKASEGEVRSARSLKADLKMDSIAAANVAFMIEDEYDIEIQIDENDAFDSVDAIVAIVRRTLEAS
jgi:acyl carrier protein